MTLSLLKSEELNLDTLRDSFPDYAKDIKLNLGTVLTPEGSPDLSGEQIIGVALATAYSVKNKKLADALERQAELEVSPEYIKAAKGAAAIMAMNNVYYRFIHQVNDDAVKALPAKLRMTIIGSPGISKIDFELMCLAVSAINGCGMCMESHSAQLRKAGVSPLGIQSAARIAAIIRASAHVLETL